MKMFDTEELLDYDFFNSEKENILFKKKLCFEMHEISPMIIEYFYQHTDKDKDKDNEVIQIVIKLLEELNIVLTALDSSIYKNIAKDKIVANCNLLETEIENAENKPVNDNQKKLIDGCINYCTKAIQQQINNLEGLPETALFNRCKKTHSSAIMHL